ncbi:MAG TPA: hypothetical protein DIS90_05285 [Cytophagales bacterium]|nr:hypothetical protein [Cytophagales bacterium]HCR53343.1 hypothetical protein [Cytophagales bacterium]
MLLLHFIYYIIIMRTEVFEAMELNTKSAVIQDFGEFVASRSYYGCTIYLYALPGFFVEVIYSGNFQSQIECIRIQNDSKVLEHYAKGIDLNLDL